MGLKVLKPQEALVLTLFGKYTGTTPRTQGFIMSILFSTSVNPAAKTKLNQSGDVDSGEKRPLSLSINGSRQTMESKANKKLLHEDYDAE